MGEHFAFFMGDFMGDPAFFFFGDPAFALFAAFFTSFAPFITFLAAIVSRSDEVLRYRQALLEPNGYGSIVLS